MHVVASTKIDRPSGVAIIDSDAVQPILGSITLRLHEGRCAVDCIRLRELLAGNHDSQEGDKVPGVVAKTSPHQWYPHGAA